MLAMLITAVLETLGVSIIIPLADAIIQPEVLKENKYFSYFATMLGIGENADVVKLVIIAVIVIYISKNCYLVFTTWLKNKYVYMVQRELSVEMLKSYSKRGYKYFAEHNFAEINCGVFLDVTEVNVMLIGFINATTRFIIICTICVFLCCTNWQIALFVMLAVVLCLLLIVGVFKKRMQRTGEKVRHYSILGNQKLKDMVLGIKEVMAMQKQDSYVSRYEELTAECNKYEVIRNVGSEIPIYLIEAICVTVMMAVVGVLISKVDDKQSFITILAAFVVGAFRILPSLGVISASLNMVSAYSANVNSVYENITEARKINSEIQKIRSDVNRINGIGIDSDNSLYDTAGEDNSKEDTSQEENRIKFSEAISVNNLSFSHNAKQGKVLNDLNLTIECGSSVAIVGESGAGKSTLADLLLGLYRPDEGSILVDGINIADIPLEWSRLIGFVPQSIYLSDATIIENVAFGERCEKIDEVRVIECLKKAKLYDFVKELPEGLSTRVGESGMRLSGGQRQRVGIARALYHNPEILILDEATSALDNDTESAVMEAIESLQGAMTMIIIAHRLTTVRNCDRIYEIKDGKAVVREYEELIRN